MKFVKKLKIASEKNFIVNLCTMKNKIKIKSYTGKINTNFHNGKYQKKAVNVFVFQ